MKWKKEPGMPGIQAPISHGGTEHDYVISHRKDQHTVSFRPPGKHEHVGTFTTERKAKAAAAEHAKASPAKKTRAQLSREIAGALVKKPPCGACASSHARKKRVVESQEMKDLRAAKESLFSALSYAGNTSEQVRAYHKRLEEIDAKMKALVK